MKEKLPEGVSNYLLQGFEEIHLPEQVAYLPTAPGWQVLGLLFLIFLAYYLFRGARRWHFNRYRRNALQAFDRLLTDHSWQASLGFVPQILKATALQTYPREQIAALSGDAWLAFLDSH